jgi:hypothetical protein
MSFSQPFFGNKAGYKKQQITGYDDDKAFAALHWTEQLRIRPLRSQTRREWPKGDFDTQIDMWDDNEIIDNNKETT